MRAMKAKMEAEADEMAAELEKAAQFEKSVKHSLETAENQRRVDAETIQMLQDQKEFLHTELGQAQD